LDLHADFDLDRHLVSFDLRQIPHYRFDVVVLGGGAAGSMAALAAADAGGSVALIAKAGLGESNTNYAQGGMAAVLGAGDSLDSHVADTLAVGCGLADVEIVTRVVQGGAAAIERLVGMGAEFDRQSDGALDLSKEGGHSHHRVVHARGDSTGREIQGCLREAVESNPDISSFPQVFAVDLLSDPDERIIGVLCRTARGEPVTFAAAQVVLATGGAGQIFRETTNPVIATADGVAMALRAGAAVRDLEFVQYHPTCLYIAGAARVLISEIVRGAGGVLRDRHGERFMPDHHPAAELAPRDVVSRAVLQRMVATADTSVYLDLSDLDRDPHRAFPGISRICHFFGIDIGKDLIPVRPGCHYQVGGILVDPDGRTSIPGLWAVGECASSGLHGANRMGSNSLLEAMVLGEATGRAAMAANSAGVRLEGTVLHSHGQPKPTPPAEINIVDLTYSLKSLMARQLGVQRSPGGMRDALDKLAFWRRAVGALTLAEPRGWELANMLAVAHAVAVGALARDESRGVHHRGDFPEPRAEWLAHLVQIPVREGDGPIRSLRLERTPVGSAFAPQ